MSVCACACLCVNESLEEIGGGEMGAQSGEVTSEERRCQVDRRARRHGPAGCDVLLE